MQWSVIHIEGSDAVTFLQGQFTSDISALTSENKLSAYCNIQGRAIATFFLRKENETILLTLPTSMVSIVLNRLRKFVLRSKVTLKTESLDVPPYSQAELIQAGIPILQPENSEEFVAQRLNLDTLGAIDFKKGCYVGQEIIARLHYRGQSKHHLYRIKVKVKDEFLPQSPLLNEAGEICGHILMSIRLNEDTQIALAVLSDSLIESTAFTLDS